ncbi:flagellar assembly protein FliW [Acetivibrio cellulolyticus]|uniref:flagellar assembly protein FliW n=1 Tax=Acetivibrio cellulolyticus TaxID=35830 RepID=UPI0001E30130|nr:flagellar assembly protein FliW [Acetivibrio cellulolyticus]
MLLNTKHFGEIEIDEKKIINFKEGIPGFEDTKRYIVLYNGDETSPFKWLQSVDNGQLAFAVVNPFEVVRDYDIEIPDEAISNLNIESAEEVMVLSIVVVPEELSKMTMNLKAPVVINTKNNYGMQVVLDTDMYSVRHYIIEELRRQEVNIGAGSDKKEK